MELKNNPIVKAAAIIAVVLLAGVVASLIGHIMKELLSIIGSILQKPSGWKRPERLWLSGIPSGVSS